MEADQQFQFFSNTDDLDLKDNPQALEDERTLKVRLDKWLWAARFFKTRTVARAAIEKGKIFYNGERPRPSWEIDIGAVLRIQQGSFEKTVVVKKLSTRRRSIEEALQLFEEVHENALPRIETPEWRPVSHHNAPPVQREQPRERRVVRFLRRSLNRGESRSESTRFPKFKSHDIEIFD